MPVFSIICQYFPVFPSKCHWHGKYAYLSAFCQPCSVYIQALNWYRFFSDFEMLYLTAIRNYQASLRYQYWSLSQTGSSLDEVSSGLARMQYWFFSASSAKLSQEMVGAQWLSGRVLDSRPKGSGFEPHRRHCVVVLEQDTFILA